MPAVELFQGETKSPNRVNNSPVANVYLCIHGPSIVHSAPQSCTIQGANCIYDKLNLSADGLQRLRASTRDQQFQITVERLITPYPDGVLLQLLAEFVQEVVYQQYYEQTLRIPPNAALVDLAIKNAPELRTIIVAAANNQLTSLQVQRSALRSVPDAFRNLNKLQHLDLDYNALETLSLDAFGSNSKIFILSCSYNKITQLVASRNASLIVPLVDLLLSYNRLKSINGSFFRPLQMLKFVNFDGNQIQRIEGAPLSLPQVKYISFMQNRLSQLDVSRWNVPELVEIFLERNNLTRIPIGIERLPSLTSLVLQNNLLTVVDMRRFENWTILQKIDLSGNLIRNVITSGTGRILLPNVTIVNLSQNQLTRVEYRRWDIPKLGTLMIAFNQFQQLPDLFQLFPKLNRVIAFQNPFLCSAIRRWQQYIADFKLSVDTTAFGLPSLQHSKKDGAIVVDPSGHSLASCGGPRINFPERISSARAFNKAQGSGLLYKLNETIAGKD
uniref:Leucine rich immune protein (Coil-less) n=1 Tax=Anopheles culicifacies TaxID=139723 RepID=A0A182MCR7_9DIPT